MRFFSVHSNKLHGALPASLANWTQLQLLDLSKNGFIGTLPQYFTLFHDLRALNIGHNKLHGCIPQGITNLTMLHLLDLSNNKFSGMIPTHLERLLGFVDVSTDTIRLLFEMEIVMKGSDYILPYLWCTNTIFDLSFNNLTGKIPSSIGSMSSLRLLNLSGNQLEGKIPTSLGGISTLEQLDLAKNDLEGQIPKELSKLHGLAFLNVSSNHLCGQIPKGTQLSTFNVSSFENNKCLWGCPLYPCNESERQAEKSDNISSNSNVRVGWLHHVEKSISLIALGIGIGIGFGGVVVIFMLWGKAKHWMLSPNIAQPYYGQYKFPA